MIAAHRNLAPSSWVMAQAKSWPEKGRLLDFAAGSGRHSRALADRFHIVAVDRDADALAALAPYPNITTLLCDLESDTDWPFAHQTFDIVLVTNYLYRPKLAQIYDLIAPDGYLAYETFAFGNAEFGRPKNPDFLLKEGELAARLPPDFNIIDSFHGKISDPYPAMIQRLAARRSSGRSIIR